MQKLSIREGLAVRYKLDSPVTVLFGCIDDCEKVLSQGRLTAVQDNIIAFSFSQRVEQ
jgi:hypothetical protein